MDQNSKLDKLVDTKFIFPNIFNDVSFYTQHILDLVYVLILITIILCRQINTDCLQKGFHRGRVLMKI